MKTNEVKDIFQAMLCDIYEGEKLLEDALPKMADAASDPMLKEGFRRHLAETKMQIKRLDAIHAMLDIKIKSVGCDPLRAIIKDGETLFKGCTEGPVRDAALIAVAQKAEHYEIACYGTLIAFAQSLNYAEAVDLLRKTLDEEKSCDASLSEAACSHINRDAAMKKAA